MTTLEEVFLRLASDGVDLGKKGLENGQENGQENGHDNGHENYGNGNGRCDDDVVIPVGSGGKIAWRRSECGFLRAYWQMLLKRVLIARRDWKVRAVFFSHPFQYIVVREYPTLFKQ